MSEASYLMKLNVLSNDMWDTLREYKWSKDPAHRLTHLEVEVWDKVMLVTCALIDADCEGFSKAKVVQRIKKRLDKDFSHDMYKSAVEKVLSRIQEID